MFTGIVSDGFIASILPDAEGWELVVDAPKFGSIVQIGDSVAIDGACLTVFKIDVINVFLRSKVFRKFKFIFSIRKL